MRRPDPPLTFDEALEVLQLVYVGDRVSVSVFVPPDRGFPLMTIHGWLNELHDLPIGAMAWLAREPGVENESFGPPAGKRAGNLVLPRQGFHRAGEAADAEALGPLALEFEHFEAVISGERVPDWTRLQRPSDR